MHFGPCTCSLGSSSPSSRSARPRNTFLRDNVVSRRVGNSVRRVPARVIIIRLVVQHKRSLLLRCSIVFLGYPVSSSLEMGLCKRHCGVNKNWGLRDLLRCSLSYLRGLPMCGQSAAQVFVNQSPGLVSKLDDAFTNAVVKTDS